jgi:MFS family permease
MAQEQDLIIARVRADEGGKEALGRRHTLVHAFADARVWALALVYFCGAACLYAVNFWMPTIIQELGAAGVDYLRVGLISMIPWGAAAIAMVPWSMHSDRTGERRWHSALGLGAAMVGLLLLALIGHDPSASIAALCLVTCGTLCWVVTFWSLPTAFLSGTAAAAGIALINSVGNLGGHFGPDLIGRIRTAMGGASEGAFLALAAASLLGALVTLLAPKTHAAPIGAKPLPVRSGSSTERPRRRPGTS